MSLIAKRVAFAFLLSMSGLSACYGFQAAQTIAFDSIPDKTVGDPGFTLNAMASSGLPVIFEVISGPATLSGTFLTLTGKGIVIVRSRQAGDENYLPAHADRRFVVNAPGCEALRISGQIIDSCSKNGVLLLGQTYPVVSRATLDSLERHLINKSYPDLPDNLVFPKTQAAGQMLEDYRKQRLEKDGSNYIRRLEFVMSDSLVERLQELGVDVPEMILAHGPALTEVWSNSIPSINRIAKIKRVIILSRQMFSSAGGGWRVVNDPGYSWWPNDEFNGVRGEIPYDIESRWAMDETWSALYPFFVTDFKGCDGKPGCRIDYGMLHELTHHLPVGDNYVYNMAQGNNLYVPQPDGRSLVYTWADLRFMENDHMSSPVATMLTPPATYHMKYYWHLNPMHAVAGQSSAYPAKEVYGRFFFKNFTFVLKGLHEYGIGGCVLMHETDGGNGRKVLTESTQYEKLAFTNDECIITLNQQQQLESFPGRYIGIRKGDVLLPLYFPRNLLETLYWKEALVNSQVPDNYNLEIKLEPGVKKALAHIGNLSEQQPTGDISMYPSILKAYFYNDPDQGVGTEALMTAKIDNFNNYYTAAFHESRFNLTMFPSAVKVKLLPGSTSSRRLLITGGEYTVDWSIDIAEPASWLDVSEMSGSVESNQQVELDLEFAAGNLEVGTYSNTLHLTNAFNDHVISIPVQLEIDSNPVTVYPNPATDVVQIRSLSNIISYSLTDCSGRVIANRQLDPSARIRNVDLEVAHLCAGIYFLKCSTEDIDAVKPVKVTVWK